MSDAETLGQQLPKSDAAEILPPPPPGPPPQPKAAKPAYHHESLPSTHLDQPSPWQDVRRQQQQQQYSIPPYDPANPVFAPPPTQPAAQDPSSTHDEPALSQIHPQIHPETHAPPHTQTQSQIHGDHSLKTSWGERFSKLGIKAAAPINSLAHKLGSQSFLPETMDRECDKAAAILKSFCKKGVYAADPVSVSPSTAPDAPVSTGSDTTTTKTRPKDRLMVTIPPKVIAKAVGLAIFTTFRAGYGVSGATGSGVLVARLPDGSWSPPSGIQLHSVGGGFQIGVDIYDCVCVINSEKALEAFMDTRVSLGSDLAVVAGPYGAGAAVDFGAAVPDSRQQHQGKAEQADSQTQHQQGQKEQPTLKPPLGSTEDSSRKGKGHRRGLSASATKPVFSYVKSRGLYVGVSVDGTVVAERKEANSSFYGQGVTVRQILKGLVPTSSPSSSHSPDAGVGLWPAGAQALLAALRGAEAGAGQTQGGREEEEVVVVLGARTGDENQHQRQDEVLPGYVDDGQHHVQDVKYR